MLVRLPLAVSLSKWEFPAGYVIPNQRHFPAIIDDYSSRFMIYLHILQLCSSINIKIPIINSLEFT